MGLTEEDKKKVFSRFYRVDKARSRERGGNGLGLSIAKELIEGYNGKISLTSRLNHGSLFKVKLLIENNEERYKKFNFFVSFFIFFCIIKRCDN